VDNAASGIEIGAKIENLCMNLNFTRWFVTSAKTRKNIEECMTYVVSTLMKKHGSEWKPQKHSIQKKQTNCYFL